VQPLTLVGARPAAQAPGSRRVARAPEPEAARQVVEILRGDLFERRDFERKGGSR